MYYYTWGIRTPPGIPETMEDTGLSGFLYKQTCDKAEWEQYRTRRSSQSATVAIHIVTNCYKSISIITPALEG